MTPEEKRQMQQVADIMLILCFAFLASIAIWCGVRQLIAWRRDYLG